MLRHHFCASTFDRSLGLFVLWLAACSGRAGVGSKCATTSDCQAGLACVAKAKTCQLDSTSSASGPVNPTGPAIAVTVTATADPATVYLGSSVKLTAVPSVSSATLAWVVAKPDGTTDSSLPATLTPTFTPTAVGTYNVTVTATTAGQSGTGSTTFVVKAATLGAWIAFDQAVDGNTDGYYAFGTDLAQFRRMDTPGNDTPNGFVALGPERFAYAFLAADLSGHELHVGPQASTPSATYGKWAGFASGTCELGTAGTPPTRGGGGGTCYQPIFNLDSDGSGSTLAFLVGRSNTADTPTGGDLWVVDPAGSLVTSAIVTIPTSGNPITAAGLSVDGQKVAVVQSTGDNLASGLGLIANVASPSLSTITMASKITYERPKVLPDGRILAVRRLGAAAEPPAGSSPMVALVAATAPYSLGEQTVLFGLEGAAQYKELLRESSGPAEGVTCTNAKSAGALGVSRTQELDYALSPDYRYVAIWQYGQTYSNCADLSTPTGASRRVVVLDLQTGALTPLSLQALGVADVGAGGTTDSRGFLRAQFIGEGQQVVMSLSQFALGNADLRADLYIANRDGTGARKVLGSGDAVPSAAGAHAAIIQFH